MRKSTKRTAPRSAGFKLILPLTLALSAATFWGVWTLSAPATNAATGSDTESAAFSICGQGPRTNCIVDGDTLYYQGVKIRIADIDTPETNPPRCAEEGRLGNAATQRLLQLANAGPFTLQSIDRDEDRYNRKLRVMTRKGESLGGVLVDEGLARWYQDGRRPWC